jgi:hypothetical protein
MQSQNQGIQHNFNPNNKIPALNMPINPTQQAPAPRAFIRPPLVRSSAKLNLFEK